MITPTMGIVRVACWAVRTACDNHDLNLEADEVGRKSREKFFSGFRIA